MRIWLIGADKIGSEALQQLQKNPAITVIGDASDRPKAVSDCVIAKVDMVENVTPGQHQPVVAAALAVSS